MPLSQLQQAIAHYRAALRANEARAEFALQQAHNQTVQVINQQLQALYDAMDKAVADGHDISKSFLYEEKRLSTIEQMITGQIDHFGALTQMQVAQLQHMSTALGTQAGQALLNASKPAGVNFSFGVPSEQAIANLVGATQSGPLSDLFSGFGREAAQAVKSALISGVTLGDGPRQIAPQIQDALNISRARALTIARTESLRSYRGANQETFKANSDVVDQWRWTCALSARTCAACLAMDGSLHDLDESMDSHPNCRCVMTPVTKSWSDILSNTGVDTSGLDDGSATDDMQTGDDWFSNQDEATQRQVLGNAGYDLYSSGQADLQDFVGKTSDPVWGDSIYQKSVKQIVKAGR